MTHLEILKDVIAILETDYAGFSDKKNWVNTEYFIQKLGSLEKHEPLSNSDFVAFMGEMLIGYKDAHMYFLHTDNTLVPETDNGFEVRRYEDKLHVVDVWQEKNLHVGDVIVALDGKPVSELAITHQQQLEYYGPGAEREIWKPVIKKYKTCTLLRSDNSVQELPLNSFPKHKYTPEYSLQMLSENIPLLKLTDFSNDNAINQLIEEHKTLLSSAEQLIIDVRVNKGGSDSAYLKLLEYLFDKDISLVDLDETPMQLNMTERNYQLRKAEMASYMAQVDDPNAKKFIEAFLEILETYRNQGLVVVDMQELLPSTTIKVRKGPKQVVVLTDVYCGSSGDSFVDVVSKSEKVTVIGRPTAGITDYSNLTVQPYGEQFQFLYPTSRNKLIDDGKGITGKGHQPHHYIPWTPEHLERDVDLEAALKHLK